MDTSKVSLLDNAVGIAAELDLQRVSDESLKKLGTIIADTVGVSYGGSHEKEMSQLLQLYKSDGIISAADDRLKADPRVSSSTVFGEQLQCSSPEQAAFLNSTAGSFLELDEGMRPTGHPGMQLVPPAIAVAEHTGASGTELLRAILAGYEVTNRLFWAFRLRYPVHPHGHFGAVGGAVAVALLRNDDPVAAARIAATSPILSIWDACYEGATARNSWMGLASQTAVRASTLATAGFTGSSRSMEIAFGEIAGELVNPDRLTAPLDYNQLGIHGNYFKRHSACALNHAALDALFQLSLPEPGRIQSVVVETVSNNMKLNRQAQPNNLSARFSLPYAIASAILTGKSDPAAFNFRSDVAELAQRVEVTAAQELEKSWPDASPARVTVHWDGGSESAQVDNPRGYHSNPLTDVDLKQKFVALLRGNQSADAWWDRLTNLSAVENCSTIFRTAHR